MPSSPSGDGRQLWTYGRGFASVDPERQREVVVGFGRGPIETSPARASQRLQRRVDAARLQPERESPNFEGSSSRRGR